MIPKPGKLYRLKKIQGFYGSKDFNLPYRHLDAGSVVLVLSYCYAKNHRFVFLCEDGFVSDGYPPGYKFGFVFEEL